MQLRTCLMVHTGQIQEEGWGQDSALEGHTETVTITDWEKTGSSSSQMSHYVPRPQTHSGENSSQYQSQESQ